MLFSEPSVLDRFARRVASARRIDDLVQIVTEEVRRSVSADGTSFVLREDQACYYVEEDSISPLWKGLKFPLNTCVSGWSMLQDRLAIIPDIYEDKRVPHDAYRPTFVKSMIMLPLGSPEPLGALGVYWARQQMFDEFTISALKTLAAITSSALTSVQLCNFLLHTERKLALALDAGALGSFELNVSTLQLSASPLLKEILGSRPDRELSYRDFVDAFHKQDRDRVMEALSRTAETGKPTWLTCEMIRRDESLHLVRVIGRATRFDCDPDVYLIGTVRYLEALKRIG